MDGATTKQLADLSFEEVAVLLHSVQQRLGPTVVDAIKATELSGVDLLHFAVFSPEEIRDELEIKLIKARNLLQLLQEWVSDGVSKDIFMDGSLADDSIPYEISPLSNTAAAATATTTTTTTTAAAALAYDEEGRAPNNMFLVNTSYWHKGAAPTLVPITDVKALSDVNMAVSRSIFEGQFALGLELKLAVIKLQKEANEDELHREVSIYRFLKEKNYRHCTDMLDYHIDPPPRYIVLDKFGHNLCASMNLKNTQREHLFRVLVSAVYELHELGIVHCDLKPQNILVSYSGHGDVIVKLCDFDSAQFISDRMKSAHSGCTALSTCPEVYFALKEAKAVALKFSIDIFSLGLVLAALLDKNTSATLTILPSSTEEETQSCSSSSSSSEADTPLQSEYERCLTDQFALWNRVNCGSKSRYRTIVQAMCYIDESARASLKDVLIFAESNTASQIYKQREELEQRLKEQAETVLSKLSGITTKLDQLHVDLLQGFYETKRFVLETSEVKTPSCFIITTCKLGDSSSLSVLAEKVHENLTVVGSLVKSVKTFFSERKAGLKDLKKNVANVCVGKRFYLYLVDERTMEPIVKDPYEIFPHIVTTPAELVQKLYPLLHATLTVASMVNGALGLVRCLGYPVPEVSSAIMEKAQAVVDGMGATSSIAAFDRLEAVLLMDKEDISSPPLSPASSSSSPASTIRGESLRQLSDLLVKIDPNRHFCGLRMEEDHGQLKWMKSESDHQLPSPSAHVPDSFTKIVPTMPPAAITAVVTSPSIQLSSVPLIATLVNDPYAPSPDATTADSVPQIETSISDGSNEHSLLGYKYYRGSDGVAPNYSLAVEHFQLAANDGAADVQYMLGLCYAHGAGVPKNDTEAVKYFQLAADQGYAAAQCCLGVCYENGTGLKTIDTEAVKYYMLAAGQGDAAAQYNMGVRYDTGKGVPKNNTEAVKYYKLAADQGHAAAQCNLGDENGTGLNPIDTEAAKDDKLAADQGNAAAQYNLGVCYDAGKGVPNNDTEAVKYDKLAADQGDAAAQYNMGVCYENGTGVPKRGTEALRYYKLAAHQGHAAAQCCLGERYDTGKGVQKNDTEAVKYYKLAADQGYAAAQCNLGVCYANGTGLPKNDTEAVKHYMLAAHQGNADAQCNLGVRYDTGKGVPKNNTEAVRYYKLAADQGHAAA